MKKTGAVGTLVSFFDDGQKSSAVPTKVLDDNMNSVSSQKCASKPPLTVGSDDDNYINNRMQQSSSSPSPVRKLSLNQSLLNNNNNSNGKQPSDPDDIKSHLWYHGDIGRNQAEQLVTDASRTLEPATCAFLVRDCISRPGDYVLTCSWQGKPLHFMINRLVSNGNSLYERVAYNFEDESYRSVPDLIRAYVGQRKPVTEESKCVITTPVNRLPSFPTQRASTQLRQTVSEKSVLSALTDGKLKIADEDKEQGNYVRMKIGNQPRAGDGQTSRPVSIAKAGIDNLKIPTVPESIRNRPLPPVPFGAHTLNGVAVDGKPLTLRSKVMLKEARRQQLNKWRSESALEDSDNCQQKIVFEETFSSSPTCKESLHSSASMHTLNGVGLEVKSEAAAQTAPAPSKPARAPSMRSRQEKPVVVVRDAKNGGFKEVDGGEMEEEEECDYHEYCDIDYDQVIARPAQQIKSTRAADIQPPALPPRPTASGSSNIAAHQSHNVYDRPDLLCRPLHSNSPGSCFPSSIHSKAFISDLLPTDSKPLDSRVWPSFRDFLLGTDASGLAYAITQADARFLDMYNVDTAGKSSLGLVQLLLPQGAQLRRDVLERAACWRFMVISSILNDESPDLRVRILSKWIDAAAFAKEQCGNDFAFSYIVGALLSPQVAILSSCWQKLRTDYTSQAQLFDTALRQEYYSMQKFQKCDRLIRIFPSRQQPQLHSCIPDLEPLVKLLEATTFKDTKLFDWEDEDDNFGLDSFWLHLSAGRNFFSRLTDWHKNLVALDGYMQEEFTGVFTGSAEDWCRTEFHIRYLFGSRCIQLPLEERHEKFWRILTAMSTKIKASNVS